MQWEAEELALGKTEWASDETHTRALSTDSPSDSLSDTDKTPYCARPQTITDTHIHTLLVLCLQRLAALSLRPAASRRLQPPAPKESKRINSWSTSHFHRLLLRGWSRGRWDNAILCLGTPTWCNVPRRRNIESARGEENRGEKWGGRARAKPAEGKQRGIEDENRRGRISKSLQLPQISVHTCAWEMQGKHNKFSQINQRGRPIRTLLSWNPTKSSEKDDRDRLWHYWAIQKDQCRSVYKSWDVVLRVLM